MKGEKKISRCQRIAINLRSIWLWSIGFVLVFFIFSAIMNSLNIWAAFSIIILLVLVNFWALVDNVSFFKALEKVEAEYHNIMEIKIKPQKNFNTSQEMIDYYQKLEQECTNFIESCNTLLTHKGLKKEIQFELNLFKSNVNKICINTEKILKDF